MLACRLRESFCVHSDRSALWLDDRDLSYRQLEAVASRLRDRMSDLAKLWPIGILTTRSLSAYAGALAAVLDGRPYLPLNVDYPIERLRRIMDGARPAAILLGEDDLDVGLALQSSCAAPPALVLLDAAGDRVGMRPAASTALADRGRPILTTGGEPPAYIMFTSGTTGEPKGIAVSPANLNAYLDGIGQLFDFRKEDRFSQFFNLSFDLSVHDLFVAWTHGASLHVPDKASLLDPVGFARRQALTVWFSVPSVASLAMRFRKLDANTLPDLRHAHFCGEALSLEVAGAFRAAAPNADLTNLYGPTEATIAITAYRLPRDGGEAGIVPIGRPFPGQETLVLDDRMTEVGPGEVGQLWLGGSQVTGGYVNDPAQTVAKFRRFAHPGRTSRSWYATGDLVEVDDRHGLLFRGRVDDQIKLHGHRIELTEVEEALRKAAGTPLAIVTPWPREEKRAPQRLIALVATPHPPAATIIDRMAASLPAFMTPTSIESVADMAFDVNGKIDRRATIGKWKTQKS